MTSETVLAKIAKLHAMAESAVKGFRPAFRNAFVNTVLRRLRESAAERDAQLRTEGNGTALVRLQNAHAAVSAWMGEQYPHTRSASGVSGRQGHNELGAARGREHGTRAGLGADGIGNGRGPRTLGGGK